MERQQNRAMMHEEEGMDCGEEEEEEVKDTFRFRNESHSEGEERGSQEVQQVEHKKKSFRTKNMRIIDEETLKMVDVEFIIKQETQLKDYLKDPIIANQLIRTTEKVKVVQLKKLIFQQVKLANTTLTLHDINMHIYVEGKGLVPLKNDQSI